MDFSQIPSCQLVVLIRQSLELLFFQFIYSIIQMINAVDLLFSVSFLIFIMVDFISYCIIIQLAYHQKKILNFSLSYLRFYQFLLLDF